MGGTSAKASCAEPAGAYIVINVPSADQDGGLVIRDAASSRARRLGVIPSNAVGVDVKACEESGWCRVSYNCTEGWSYLAKYLAPRDQRLARVVDVSPSDPDGLNLRSGPGPRFPPVGRLPYNARGLVRHTCEASKTDDTSWCLVSAAGVSGWAAGRFLQEDRAAPTPASGAPAPPPTASAPAPAPPPTPAGPGPGVPPGFTEQACRRFPDLCPLFPSASR